MNTSKYSDWARLSSIGIQMVVTILLLVYLGLKVDAYFETSPWFTVGFAFAGSIGMIIKIIYTFTSPQKNK